MDELKIGSKFTTNIVSKLVSMIIRRKLGVNVELKLNAIETTIIDGKAYVHLDTDAELEKEELLKILKRIGL